jgi:hypothetical protein
VQFQVEGTQEAGFVGDLVPEVAAELAWGELVSKQHVEDELDTMMRAIRGFWEMEPDQVMRMIMALSARCTELGVHLHRLEGKREWRQIRTLQVERILAELDRQFKNASRLLEVRRQDIEMSR